MLLRRKTEKSRYEGPNLGLFPKPFSPVPEGPVAFVEPIGELLDGKVDSFWVSEQESDKWGGSADVIFQSQQLGFVDCGQVWALRLRSPLECLRNLRVIEVVYRPRALGQWFEGNHSTRPRPGRRSRVALEPGCDSRISPASTARCTSA